MRILARRLAALACVLLCAGNFLLPGILAGQGTSIVGLDRNGDGRLDHWEYYDRQGRLVRVSVDTNFDGRADIVQLYSVDVAGGFSSRTIDVDYDGTADQIDVYRSNAAPISVNVRGTAGSPSLQPGFDDGDNLVLVVVKRAALSRPPAFGAGHAVTRSFRPVAPPGLDLQFVSLDRLRGPPLA